MSEFAVRSKGYTPFANINSSLDVELNFIRFSQSVLLQLRSSKSSSQEKIKLLSLSKEKLDEFFEIRISGLQNKLKQARNESGITDSDVKRINEQLHEQVDKLTVDQYGLLFESILPGLTQEKVCFLSSQQWSDSQKDWLKQYFKTNLIPLLSPISLDLTHPFPRIQNKTLYYIVALSGVDAYGRENGKAIIQQPQVLEQYVHLPSSFSSGRGEEFVLMDMLVQEFAADLFNGLDVEGIYPFRVTRAFDSENYDFRDCDQGVASKDQKTRLDGKIVRLETSKSCPLSVLTYLCNTLNIEENDIYTTNGPIDLNVYAKAISSLKSRQKEGFQILFEGINNLMGQTRKKVNTLAISLKQKLGRLLN